MSCNKSRPALPSFQKLVWLRFYDRKTISPGIRQYKITMVGGRVFQVVRLILLVAQYNVYFAPVLNSIYLMCPYTKTVINSSKFYLLFIVSNQFFPIALLSWAIFAWSFKKAMYVPFHSNSDWLPFTNISCYSFQMYLLYMSQMLKGKDTLFASFVPYDSASHRLI